MNTLLALGTVRRSAVPWMISSGTGNPVWAIMASIAENVWFGQCEGTLVVHQRVGVVGGDNSGSRLTPSASRPVGMAMLGSRPPSRLAMANFTFCSRSSLSNAGAEATRPVMSGWRCTA